jgi:dynein heavy chain 1
MPSAVLGQASGSAAHAKLPGDWSPAAYRTVASELCEGLDLGPSAPEVIDALVHVHYSVYDAAERLKRRQGRRLHMGPRSFLDLIHHCEWA